MKLYPALDVRSTADLVLALVDDFSPSAVETGADAMRLFFPAADARDAACAELRAHGYTTVPLEVSDEDWARRSQQDLAPIEIGRITIFPTPDSRIPTNPGSQVAPNPTSRIPNLDKYFLTILPSMGFGTGHHATTRLCLEALQEIDVTGAFFLDVGTGSGVLAIAADLLGAAAALGLDCDEDAIQSARQNLALNPSATHTSFDTRDVTAAPLPDADILAANLTGALLVRAAPALLAATRPGGTIILSGILAEEGDAVRHAFSGADVVEQRQDAEWLCLRLTQR